MSRSLAARVITPIIKKLGASANSRAKKAKGDMIREMLQQAGHPLGMGFSEFMGLKTFTVLLFGGIGLLSSFFVAFQSGVCRAGAG